MCAVLPGVERGEDEKLATTCCRTTLWPMNHEAAKVDILDGLDSKTLFSTV